MATISSTLAVNDSMTPVLLSITAALESLNATMDRVHATLDRAFDTSAIDAATSAVRQTEQAQETVAQTVQATERAQDEVTESVQATERAIDEVTESARQTDRAIDGVTQSARETERAQDEVTESMRESSNAAGDLWGKIKGFIAAYAGFELVKQTMAWSDEMTNIQARLDLINDGTRTTRELMNEVYGAAQRSHSSLQATANIVGRIGNNAREAFSSNDELLAFAEQIQKQFTISGAGAQEAEFALVQLSQGLAAGALRGEELNSVFEQAPTIIRSIAEYMNVPVGQIRKLAAEGKITADIVKNAMFAATEQTNAKFAAMPLTFSAAWTMAKNTFQMNMLGLQKIISETINQKQFQQIMDGLTNAISGLASFAIPVVKGIAAAVGFMYRNWSFIAPVIFTVVGAMAAYKAVALTTMAIEAISRGIKIAGVIASYAKAAAMGVEASATTAAAAAQWGLNAAMLASPVTWIIAAIAAIIGLFYLAVAAINEVTGSTYSATGMIMGALATLGAFIWNLLVGLYNGLLAILDAMMAPVIGIIDWFYTAFTGGFESIGDACLNILGKLISGALAVVKPIIEIWDWVTGMNAAGAVEAAQNAAENWGKTEEAKKSTLHSGWLKKSIGADQKSLRISYADAFDGGYNTGASFSGGGTVGGGIDNALGLADDPAIQSIIDGQKQGNKLAAETAKNTTPKAEEDYKYIRDIMAGRAVDRLSGTEIKIQMNNNNKINSALDLDSIVNALAQKLTGAMDSAAEGVHY